MTPEMCDPQIIPGLKAALDAAPALKRQITKAEAVRQLAPTIKELFGKGYTPKGVVDLLKSNGLDIQLATFRTLFRANGDKRAPGTTTAQAVRAAAESVTGPT